MTNSPYIPSTEDDKQQMLKTIGVSSFEELLSDVPKKHLQPTLNLKEALSEQELTEFFQLCQTIIFLQKL